MKVRIKTHERMINDPRIDFINNDTYEIKSRRHAYLMNSKPVHLTGLIFPTSDSIPDWVSEMYDYELNNGWYVSELHVEETL